MLQRTISKKIEIKGKALQTGTDVSIQCLPADVDAGIIFKKPGEGLLDFFQLGNILADIREHRRSTLGHDEFTVQTVEHFLAALWGLGICNIIVEINGIELPAVDGSALGFLEELSAAGIEEQASDAKVIDLNDVIKVGDDDTFIEISPYKGLNISYEIDYDCPSIGKETFEIELNEDSFRKDISGARTFCLKKEVDALLAAGLGKGATLENTLVMDENGPVDTKLRYNNEPVRHKILDIVGDMYVLGVPIQGKIRARKSGHKLNARLVREIYKRYLQR